MNEQVEMNYVVLDVRPSPKDPEMLGAALVQHKDAPEVYFALGDFQIIDEGIRYTTVIMKLNETEMRWETIEPSSLSEEALARYTGLVDEIMNHITSLPDAS